MLCFFSLYCCNFTVLPYHQANLFSVNASLCSKFKGSWRHFFLCTDMFILSWGQIQGKDFQSQAFLLSFTEITFKGIRHPGRTNTKGSTEEKTYGCRCVRMCSADRSALCGAAERSWETPKALNKDMSTTSGCRTCQYTHTQTSHLNCIIQSLSSTSEI